MKKLLLVVIAAFALGGCASVPMGSPKEDAALKQFTAPKGMAGIYVYRNETFGAAIKMDVDLDGKPIGKTAAHTYLYKVVKPGRHSVTSEAENKDTVEVNAKAGTLSYVWQEVKMGILYARTKLHVVDAADGQKGVLDSKLAKTE